MVYGKIKKGNQGPSYETAKVVRKSLVQSVDASGRIDAIDNLALRFELSGAVGTVQVKEGEIVKAGQVLGTLKSGDLSASAAQASANLRQRLAGATNEEKISAQAAVDSAKASLEQSKIDIQTQITAAEAALNTAKNNLVVAQGGNNSQLVMQAYESALATLRSVESRIDDALTQSDNILGVDNTFANDDFERYLSPTDLTVIDRAKSLYSGVKTVRTSFRTTMSGITGIQNQSAIDSAINNASEALLQSSVLLTTVYEVLNKTIPVGTLTQASLDAKKTIIETTRVSISSQQTSLVTQKQSITNAKNSLANYQVAYDKALRDLEAVRSNSENLVAIRQASYDQAMANLQSKLNPPREVDVAAYRAAAAQAAATLNKTVLRAPIDGKITKIGRKVGELISSAEVMFNLLSPHYEIQVDIPEVDIPKVKIGQKATITLDAFGPDVKLSGAVTFIDPASTLIQDVVYYKMRISLDPTDKDIKPGMTAEADIVTEERENALYLPTRFVLIRPDGTRYVKTLVNGQEQEIPVKVGLRANEARLEILEGLTEGQEVVITKNVTK